MMDDECLYILFARTTRKSLVKHEILVTDTITCLVACLQSEICQNILYWMIYYNRRMTYEQQ